MSRDPNPTVKLETIYYCDDQLVAKIYWLAKMANCNYGLRTVDHSDDIFQNIFPDSKIAPSFSLSRTSGSYKISDGLAPYFKKTIVENLPLSMYFDETSQEADGLNSPLLVADSYQSMGTFRHIILLWQC